MNYVRVLKKRQYVGEAKERHANSPHSPTFLERLQHLLVVKLLLQALRVRRGYALSILRRQLVHHVR